MIFFNLYRISFYAMLFFATLSLNVDDTESKFGFLFPIAVALSGVLAFLTVDRNPKLGLSRSVVNALALVSIGLVFVEYSLDPTQLLQSLSHFLIYLVLIKVFLTKTNEDDWFIFGLGLTQVAIAAVINQSDMVGIVLFCWAFLSLWVLALYSLRRDALRYGDQAVSGATPSAGAEPYPGLLDLPFILSALRVLALTLALGGVIFMAMPRRGIAGRMQRGPEPMAKHLTGFDEEVQLGQLGEILENDSIVMSIEMFNADKTPHRPEGEPLWRGVTMVNYDKGRWHAQERHTTTLSRLSDGQAESSRTVLQQIKLEANDSAVLFGLRPILAIGSPQRADPEINSVDGTILRPETRPGTYDYHVTSDLDPSQPQRGEAVPSTDRLEKLLALPEDLKAQLRAIAEPLVRGIPEDDVAARARAVESHLRDSGQFGYTLRMSRVDRSLDPIEDFLKNRKEGHCEYFASALTLLLRSIGIPARMVNGFKGGDWNEIAQVMNVRQKHAHSWTEAYLGMKRIRAERVPFWLTLDPTPAGERRSSLAKVGGFGSNFRQITDLVRYIWTFFIVGYNAERQRRLIYEPIQQLIQEARSGFAMMGQAIWPTIANLLSFKDVDQFISIRGFFVSFAALSLLALVFRLGRWAFRKLFRWVRGNDADTASLSAGVVFYRRLAQLLAEYGLERPPAETQSEFARRAAVFLTGRGSSTEPVSDVPRLVVDAFYRVRFGNLTLPPATLTELESRLDDLEASLRATRGA